MRRCPDLSPLPPSYAMFPNAPTRRVVLLALFSSSIGAMITGMTPCQSFVVACAILAHNMRELQCGRNAGESGYIPWLFSTFVWILKICFGGVFKRNMAYVREWVDTGATTTQYHPPPPHTASEHDAFLVEDSSSMHYLFPGSSSACRWY